MLLRFIPVIAEMSLLSSFSTLIFAIILLIADDAALMLSIHC